MNLSERVRRNLAEGGEITAITFNDAAYSWNTVRGLVDPLSAALKAADPGGQFAAIVLRNRPSGVAAQICLMAERRTSVMITPIQPALSMCADVRAINPSVVIADRQDWNDQLDEAVKSIGAAGFEIFEEGGSFGLAVRPGLERAAAAKPNPFEGAGIVVPTSGTTGPPKRVPVRWERVDSYAPAADRPVTQGHGVIQTNPLVTIGATAVFLTAIAKPLNLVLMEKLDVVKWADLVERHKPRRTGLPPAGLRMLMESNVPKEKFASIEAFVTGSAPFPPEEIETLENKFGKPLLYSYGATEFGGTGTVAAWTLETRARHRLDKRGSAGQASPGVKLRVIDPADGKVVAPGEEGILEVHKPDAPVSGPDGWIRTNDLAVIDADDFLFIRGRADDTIIRGGFKVPLGEVEAALTAHPAVYRAAAIGLPDARLGQVPAAAVMLEEGYPGEVAEAELIAWARERLNPYKVPVKVKVVAAIPMTQLLKVSRPQLRELLAD